jgi:hypothetical protein
VFTRISADASQYRDALSFANGAKILLQLLPEGQRLKLLQLSSSEDFVPDDLLVHGEFERNDMVEHFGEQLSGFVFTANGWVQSYGSRCVKPPVLFAHVSRPKPMTAD